MPLTDPARVPVTGAVTYAGSVSILADTSPTQTTLLGDAQVQMDFASGGVSGQMTDIFGVGADATLRDYAGELAITDGQVGPDAAWSLDYTGTLTGGGQVLVFQGDVAGDFYGSDAEAIAGAGFDDSVMIDGAPVDMIITIIAEQE